MKLKTRIIISFFIIVLEPLLFTVLAFCFFSHYQFRAIEKQYGIENPTYETLANTAEMIARLTNKAAENIEETANTDPERFTDIQYLDSLNKELLESNSYLVVREDDRVTYYGCEDYPSALIEKLDDSYQGDNAGISDRMYLGDKVQSLVKQINFSTDEIEQGNVYIVSNALETLPQVQQLGETMIITVILILAITALWLTWWIYRGVITPLDKLRMATQKIKAGDLNFSIATEGVSEIADLCQDFEDMRQRLKENAEEKVAFDKENKEMISNISHDLKTPITAIKG